MIPFKNTFINYSDKGSGKPIVLLHGYLETHEIWDGFADELSKSFRVIAIDIPGHGKSGKIEPVHNMDLLAEAVDCVLSTLSIDKAFFVGHSMGGYVALACLANYLPKVSGICMFHSTPFADTEEKKANRDREIALIKEGKQESIFSVGVPKGFANDNLTPLKAKVDWAIGLARKCDPHGIIALLEGLKSRPDRQTLLKSTTKPVLFILGKKDNFIPFDVMYAVAQHTLNGEVLTLENSGHMGFIEEQGICLEALSSFVMQHHH
ncbi:MAG TPA: alpha/beta hydrolase [Bacteroidales bacterium]|nr:alpha/beta hydrolase [Bacteroidales bacterium]